MRVVDGHGVEDIRGLQDMHVKDIKLILKIWDKR